ncbi:hypothetical protein DOE73_02975 [Paenibacillus dendritiformis]|nr:hypothetical protein DOE73_02975 [Paenibacillus dendritiformis]
MFPDRLLSLSLPIIEFIVLVRRKARMYAAMNTTVSEQQQLHPNVVPYWRIYRLFSALKRTALASIPIIVYLMWLPQWKWILYVVAAYLLFHWSKDVFYIIYGVRFSYARRSYVLTTDEIVIRWGSIWSVNSSVIPLSRVQHVDIEQDVIQKKLGISEVVIVTAGDATGIVGLLEDDANKLRRQVIELAKIGETDAYNP